MENRDMQEIDKRIVDILPTKRCYPDELDYSIIEQKKSDWAKLSEMFHSIVLVFDCYTNKFVFVSNNIPASYGIDDNRLIFDGHISALEIIHPDDIHYGLLIRAKIYSLLSEFSPEEKMKYKVIHEMRVKNIHDEYIRIIEQE